MSCSAPTSASTDEASRICPSAKTACSRTSALLSLSAAASAATATAVANLAERERRLLADVGARVLERRRQRLDRALIAELAEAERRLLADVWRSASFSA